MSKQQPPGSRSINTLLIAALAYTGFLLIFNSQNRGGPQRPAAEILQSMRADAAGLRDVSLSRSLPTYNQALGEEAKKTNMPEAVRRQLELEAAVLVADAEFKSAIYRQQVDKANAARAYDKLNRAYMTIKTQWNGRHTSPEWSEPVPVTPAPRLGLPEATASPKEVYDRIVAQLSAESKTHLVYGLFP
ncbi:MAG: hypothetical protein MH204_04055, partial [Fimbriimonadaceae bacterium]|nr:hypothetical protein [Fimbriimonadaceae bacterium]